MEIMYWILLILGGFLLGGIMFGELLPKIFLHKDIRAISDDHNPGTFNAFKYGGVKIGIPCLLLDVLKGFIPVLLASLFMDASNFAFAWVLVAPVFGHAVGLFNNFHGGKCIAVSFGVMLGLIPVTWIAIVVLAGLYILFSTIIRIKSTSTRSVIVYALFAIISCPVIGVLGQFYPALGCGVVALFPIIKFAIPKNGLVEKSLYGVSLNDENKNKGN